MGLFVGLIGEIVFGVFLKGGKRRKEKVKGERERKKEGNSKEKGKERREKKKKKKGETIGKKNTYVWVNKNFLSLSFSVQRSRFLFRLSSGVFKSSERRD